MKPRIIFVLETTGLAGGIKNVFELADRLALRGYQTEIYALGGIPRWFPLNAPLRQFPNYHHLLRELRRQDALKVATWWRTAPVVWSSCDPRLGGRGVPYYLVQDIEEYYYHCPDRPDIREQVLATYRLPVNYLTISEWVEEQLLSRFGQRASQISIAIDQDLFNPSRRDAAHNPYQIAACSRRSQPLKGYSVTREAVRLVHCRLPGIQFLTYGTETEDMPELSHQHVQAPDDQHVASIYANSGVFVQTSRHEGFGLPILEAMACGTPVVCTKAEGNEEFCRDGWNCLLVDKDDAEAVASAIGRILCDRHLAGHLAANAVQTARQYNWPAVLARLDAALVSKYCKEEYGG
ncbi:glycosyltransferase family 4 protein [Paenibacillus tarimensis]|uniref:glycosyltransferase family 4 protein n=1 Tax=Paenibacillus tarimensis TaxID=416012 RepID=UPI001F447E29|nr:glycosyltransferase family 4 protein [Paenibacillus tarimensis]MCF2944916.1 glycosyltransferase family 4 protein [Paenibacillus tarimensis]